MFEILTLAASLFTATPAVAQEAAAPVTTAVAPAAAPAATPTTAIAPAAVAAPVPPAAPPSIFQSFGNQVIAHDTIASMDSDGNQTVSRAEFDAYQGAQFKLMDANGDGLLSADEVGTSKKKSLPSMPSLPSFW